MMVDEIVDAVQDFLDKHEVVRWWRGLMYVCFTASGVFASVAPSRLVTEEVGSTVALCWALCMIVSSLICLYGPVTDRWIGEYAGIPLLAAVVALYGLSAIFDVDWGNVETYILVAYGLTVCGLSAGLSARWLDVRAIKNAGSSAYLEEE